MIKIPVWVFVPALLAGVLITVGTTLGVQAGLESSGEETFAEICRAVGGDVYGGSMDVCADETGQILLLDEGAQP